MLKTILTNISQNLQYILTRIVYLQGEIQSLVSDYHESPIHSHYLIVFSAAAL